jgi:hypothetical protein
MQANAESQFFLEGRGLYLDYAGPPASKPSFPPNTTLHFSNYSGDEEGLQTVLDEFAPSIKSLRISKFSSPTLLSSTSYSHVSAEPANGGNQPFRIY